MCKYTGCFSANGYFFDQMGYYDLRCRFFYLHFYSIFYSCGANSLIFLIRFNINFRVHLKLPSFLKSARNGRKRD